MRFDVTEHTSCQYCLNPVRVEIKDDTGWKICPASISGYSDPLNNKIFRSNIFIKDAPTMVLTNSKAILNYAGKKREAEVKIDFTPQSPGSHLRLVVDVQRARKGLGGFWDRLRLRLSAGQKISLNPFDNTYVIFTKEAAELIEFTEP